ncbi:ABC transporter permease [Nitriliruptoraceae bacterium ZYF776]|nr:ABC transporter permease [Profundirhabdus halotolerans]
MTALTRMTRTELVLLARDKATLPLTFLLPLGLLVGFGSGDGMREPLPEYGGLTAFDLFIVPIALVLVVTMLALQVFPVTLATYRERGILKRLATTPISPSTMLGAQLLVHVALLVTSLGLTAVVAGLAFDVSAPADPWVGLGVLLAGAFALYAMGMAVAALVPRTGTATAVGMGLFFPQLLLGGLMVPADQLPDVLATIGEFTPVGATLAAVQDAWVGDGVAALHLAVLAGWTLVCGAVAARRFRWS